MLVKRTHFKPLFKKFAKIIFFSSKKKGFDIFLDKLKVTISVSPHVCFILVLILISVFLR